MNLETFLKKFRTLRDASPHLFSSSMQNENCLYTDAIAYSKNCYYLFTGGWAEDCYYGEFLVKCKDCVDSLKVEGCELCYECVDCSQCSRSAFLLNCNTTHDSEYCFSLRDCHDCFLSSNQHHKSYLFKNRQYGKEQYLDLVSAHKKAHSARELYVGWRALCDSAIRINLTLLSSENCIGNNISNSKDCYHSFDIVNGEGYLYSEEAGYGRDSCDVCISGEGELQYECIDVVSGSYNCSFCISAVTCVNCELCSGVYNLTDCFGCFYLKGKRFYILNEAYTPEEYARTKGALRSALIEAKSLSLDLFL